MGFSQGCVVGDLTVLRLRKEIDIGECKYEDEYQDVEEAASMRNHSVYSHEAYIWVGFNRLNYAEDWSKRAL